MLPSTINKNEELIYICYHKLLIRKSEDIDVVPFLNMQIMSKDGGVLLKDNFDGGATWAYEIGSQSMVCPIIVEDLNPPRQMLVEVLFGAIIIHIKFLWPFYISGSPL